MPPVFYSYVRRMENYMQLNRRFLVLILIILLAGILSGTADILASPVSDQKLYGNIAGLTPPGWKIYEGIKQFTSETLYRQINGRAEFFISYDMVRMTFATFINSTDSTQFIDLSIYDMGTATNAFGVFSTERSEGESALDYGRDGYHSDANVFVWKGRYYIKVIASNITEQLRRTGMDLAKRMTGFLEDSGEQVWGLTALPGKNRLRGSVKYFKIDAMGLDFMRETYTAGYRKGDAVVTLFLSRRESPESVNDALARYEEYGKRYGKGVERMKVDTVELILCHMGRDYDVLFGKGPLMGGAISVRNRDLAVRTAIEFFRQLRHP